MSRRVLVALVVAALARSLVLGLLIPPYQSSDEPWHLDYARALADGELPVLGETRMDPAIVAHDEAVTSSEGLTLYGIDDPPMSREAFQPPLGYALPAVAYRLSGSDPARGLIAFRAINAVLGALLVVLAVHLAAVAFPDRRHAALLAGLTALGLPAVALVASTANNDAPAAVLSLLVLLQAVRIARAGDRRTRDVLILGALVGLGAWTKASVAVLIVPAVVAVALPANRDRRRRLVDAALAVGAFAAVVAPWWIRDLAVYGDVGGTRAFGEFSPAPGREIGGPGLFLHERATIPRAGRFWPRLAQTTVGVLRWTDLYLPLAAYLVAGVATLAGGVVAAAGLRRSGRTDHGERRVVAVLASGGFALLAALVWFAYDVDFQPQGRYLLPASISTAAVVGAFVRPRGAVVGGAVLVGLLACTIVLAGETWGWG